MNRTKVADIKNNIVYVEPNYIDSVEEYGANGLNTYEFAPPLEDYSIFVNLEVETRGRTVQSSKSSGGKKYILSFVSSTDGSSSVNFMQGSKIPIGENGATINSLTTNYTDIFLRDLKQTGPSTETFGIESIDVAYNSYMVPEVTIEFVDVRGVALFAQKELYETNKNTDTAIDGNNSKDIANTFFQCFFMFPYPKFTLLIKGFYGQPVSYELTCADFRARFDSRTGNFACTAKFVGYHFSFLNDVMMNGLIAAPYSDYIGADYWDRKKFKVIGNSGEPIDMPKIGTLLAKMKDIETMANRISQSDPTAQEKTELDKRTERYNEVESAYGSFVRSFNELISEEEYKGVKIVGRVHSDGGLLKAMVYMSPNDNNEQFRVYTKDKSGQVEGLYGTFEELLKKYNEDFPEEPLPVPDKFYDSNPSQRISTLPNHETKATMGIHKNEDIKENYPDLYNLFKSIVEDGNLKGVNPLLEYKHVYYYSDNKFSETLEEYKKKNGESVKEVEEKIEKLKDTAISETLKFHPTVENMTKIVMAHFETFARMIFKTAETISNEKPLRTIGSLKVNNTRDLSDVSNKSKSLDTIVPPFPKVTSEVKRENSTIREESWVGDYGGDFREKDLVHGLINGVNEVSEYIKNYKSSGDTGADGSTTPVKTTMKFPLSPIDMVASNKTYAENGYDENDVSSLLGLIGLRAIQTFGTINFDDWGDKASILGKAEAYNFLSDNNISKELGEKLSTLSGGDVLTMMYGDSSGAIKKPGNGSTPWPWRLNPNGGGIISTNGDLDICRVKNDSFSIPYQNLGWDGIKYNIINTQGGIGAIWSEDYLNSRSFSNVTKDNIFTFDTNISRFSTIAENQLKGIEEIEYYQNKFTNECKHDSSKYKDFLRGSADDVIAYIIENASAITPSDGSCMLPTSKGAFSDKSFKGGFDMDDFHKENPGKGGDGWLDKDNNEVKRKGGDGYDKYLEKLNYLDFTFTEFAGLKPNLEPYIQYSDPGVSVFSQLLYYKETDVRVKAMLFLASIGYVVDYKEIINDFICKKEKTMAVIPLPAVLFIGALLWSREADAKKAMKFCNTGHYNDEIDNLSNKLRKDVQRKFIKTFLEWIDKGIKTDTLLRSFNDIRKGMELTLIHETTDGKKRTHEEFFEKLGEIEDKNWLGGTRTWFKKFDESYNSISDFLKGELSDDFFRNYITIDEDIYGSTTDGTRGMRLGVRDGGTSSIHASNLALAGCVFSKNTRFFNDLSTNIKVDTGVLESFFDGFLSIVKDQKYGSDTSVSEQISQALDPNNTNTDIKIGIYRYCKMIYDKWIAGITEADFMSQWTVESFFEGPKKYFYFIDAFYNVTEFIPINIGDFCDQIVSCYKDEQYSLLSFLSSVYAKNKMNFLCVQNFIDLGDVDNMKTMFDPVPYTDVWEIKRHPNFIVMYPYESSNYLADIDNSEYENDSFMINQPNSVDNIWPEPLTSRNANASIRYNIPAFGVSYGRLYQSYFKDIDVSMDNPTVTEQSIKAQFAIACQNNEGEQTGDRSKLYTYGQDLYSIYSNNSYTCNITMMGCAWVQPLMYFVLNNVPMFRGTYLIEKVTHHIEPGNMVTKFMGVRMANVCTRIAREEAVRARNDQTGNDYGDGPSPMEKLASVDNDCPYKEYPLTVEGGDVSNVKLSGNEKEKANSIMKILTSLGYTTIAAAGMVGNMYEESTYKGVHFNEKALVVDNNGCKAGGICQWNSQRLLKLVGWQVPSGSDAACRKSLEVQVSDLPEIGGQISFLNNEIIKDFAKIPAYSKKYAYFKQFIGKNLKELLNSATTPEEAAKIFAAVFERCSVCMQGLPSNHIRVKKARAYYNDYNGSATENIQIEKNADKHISDLATGFLNALNKTAAASSNGNVSIGVDSERSSGDVLLLKNGNNSDKFSTVLDMILSAYSSKVKTVCWVLPGDGQNIHAVPKYYLVNVNEGSNAVSVLVTTEDDLPRNINNESVFNMFNNGKVHVSTDKNTNDYGIHNDYCKALVKKYKSPSMELKKDTAEQLDDYEKLFEVYKVTDCNTAMEEAGITNGTGGVENESGFIGDWNVGKFVNRLHYWQANICEHNDNGKPARERSNGGKGGCGWCTGVTTRALRDSGFGNKYTNLVYPWDLYEKLKSGGDFVEIETSTSAPSNVEFTFGTPLQKGDICVMWKSGVRNEDVHYYHTCSFDGSVWYSDYKQNACNAYRKKSKVNLEWHLFRHK